MEAKDKRNLNPTPEAVVAMWLYGQEYSQQIGGSMDFWDKLSEGRKQSCRDIVRRVLEAVRAHGGALNA